MGCRPITPNPRPNFSPLPFSFHPSRPWVSPRVGAAPPPGGLLPAGLPHGAAPLMLPPVPAPPVPPPPPPAAPASGSSPTRLHRPTLAPVRLPVAPTRPPLRLLRRLVLLLRRRRRARSCCLSRSSGTTRPPPPTSSTRAPRPRPAWLPSAPRTLQAWS